jgi:hypothetical protein
LIELVRLVVEPILTGVIPLFLYFQIEFGKNYTLELKEVINLLNLLTLHGITDYALNCDCLLMFSVFLHLEILQSNLTL